jgi:predicted transposase YbfD/YdcC
VEEFRSIGVAITASTRDGKETVEKRYYISSLPVRVKQSARAVRGHWGIENSCHWSLDMTFREDESLLALAAQVASKQEHRGRPEACLRLG